MFMITLSYGLLLLSSIIICRWIWGYFSMRRTLISIPGPKSIPFIGLSLQLISVPNENGYLIPKGTTLTVNIYMLHHNPEIWADAEKFDPDRFLPENIHSKSPYAHVPFSAGPRNCIGQKFAYLELKTALTAILRRWQVLSVRKPSEMKLISNIILRAHDEKIELYFKPRK